MSNYDRRVPSRILRLVVGLLALIALLPANLAYSEDLGPEQSATVVPSVQTMDFVEVYATGDEVLADALASPLYRAEWKRLGVSAKERMELRLGHGPQPKALRFSYVGGVRSAGGFGHFLFAVSPIPTGAQTERTYSVWRVDTAPDGRVIWLDLVWIFGTETEEINLVTRASSLAATSVPADAAATGAKPLVGIVSTDTGEGHYLMGLGKGGDATKGCAPSVIRTYTVDADGQFRPGAWGYGLSDHGVDPYPAAVEATPRIKVEPEDTALLAAYLDTLG
jgi:hypothetical protein